ncbi:hypothetical protein [Bradyrhizobium japonicum]|jgi:hypothetical protein|uniref:hypothetical protein n=1 Tax=Bradyrhizobium japonicum TaxID=375 RepID=UPI00209CAB05|nr:hypothetical protein [Bradyrhizobium japonicum]MCP1765147.1 hypothetical protein [Bradyrhizobium japonicum]MCP1787284.1 hypothetical protein [Bradyrhizobium japonicum]MCP1809161.1 hypothetical protein [Bradyrhizobium japonicum]MCP1818094.1 hypothetical protein [Bradyrhizobium japonicum]MCP1870397.1 hypothetical protein [Bradyrhizobium japonicum]
MRQRRDKKYLGPEYEHIPRDAAGDPVFLILPDGVRASFERKMANWKAAWLATGDPLAISSAHTLTMLHRQVSPLWLDEAILSLTDKRRTKIHAKRAIEAAVRLIRYMAVRDARASGLTWDAAYEEAERVLATNPAAKAQADTIKQAYQEVKRDLKTGRGGRYFTPHQRKRPKP